jgi:hypothetical protein
LLNLKLEEISVKRNIIDITCFTIQ